MIYNFDIQLKDNFYKLDIEGIFTYKKVLEHKTKSTYM